MREELSEVDWESTLSNKNTQDSWSIIHNKINGLIEKHVPMKKYRTAGKHPWYNRKLNALRLSKKKLWNKYRKNPSDENWSLYASARNQLTHSIERTKEAYENKIASEVKTNPKQFWKYVSSQTKSKGKIVELINKNGIIVKDDLDKAEALNEHFASVFTIEDTNNIPTLDLEKEIKILNNVETTTETITDHLKKLTIGKAAGPDGINSRVLKEIAEQIAPGLKNLFDTSMNEGVVPVEWKEANVVALFKKGSKKSTNNYRPVSLTSICCKTFEKIIRNEIVKSMEDQGLLDKDQHGFLGGRSCNTQLLEVMEIWTKWIDLGIPWDTIYTDFSKAFDSVPHKRLLNKLHAYGIRGNLLQWIKNFLSDRKQRVVIGQETSGWRPVTSGIPQGSVLGPVLFTIFINDMPKLVQSMMKLFADDAKIFKAIESVNDIETIQDDINKLLQWSFIWQLPLNVPKCKILHYGKNNPNHTYYMGNRPLATDSSETDVGVTFDTQLSFKLHMRNMIAKANSRVGLIKRSFSCLNKRNFLMLYKSLVRPILEYCSAIWNPQHKYQEVEIEKVQERATKVVPSVGKLDYQ